MSGGSLDYLYSKIQDQIPQIAASEDPLYRAFAKHLGNVAKALREIEWVLSRDTSPGELDRPAILKCLQPGAELSLLIDEARATSTALIEAIAKAEGAQ